MSLLRKQYLINIFGDDIFQEAKEHFENIENEEYIKCNNKQLYKNIIEIFNQEMNNFIEPNQNNIILNEPLIVNRGTGAGGSNTNVNGLSYEDKTNLNTLLSEVSYTKKKQFKTIKFNGYPNELIDVSKSNLYKYMNSIGEKSSLQPAAGCKNPDEAYIDNNKKIVFIIEKKFQQTSGSVDEKIQTGPFKKLHYSQQFPNYKIYYIYCLSDWFKRTEYNSVLDYNKQNEIVIFWGNDEDYKSKIIEFICNSL